MLLQIIYVQGFIWVYIYIYSAHKISLCVYVCVCPCMCMVWDEPKSHMQTMSSITELYFCPVLPCILDRAEGKGNWTLPAEFWRYRAGLGSYSQSCLGGHVIVGINPDYNIECPPISALSPTFQDPSPFEKTILFQSDCSISQMYWLGGILFPHITANHVSPQTQSS